VKPSGANRAAAISPAARQVLCTAVLAAGAAIMRHRGHGFAVDRKADASPVTVADREAEAILLEALAIAAPGVPVVAEEEFAAGRVPAIAGLFFLVDALDGTKEFVEGGDDFTVNVGLVRDGTPVFGIVFAPARALMFWGDVDAGAAWRMVARDGASPEPIRCGPSHPCPRAVASKSHCTAQTEAYLAACRAGERLSIGSSLKFALVASAEADLYPRAGPTMEWDTAAGDAVLRAAGGMSYGLDGCPLAYGKPGFFNPGFVAAGTWTPAPLGTFYPTH